MIEDINSLIWTRRYNECGDFELVTSVYRNIPLDYYMYYPKYPRMLMIIEEKEIETNVDDAPKFIYRGRDLKSILERRIVWNQTTLQGNFQEGIEQLIKENITEPANLARKISNFRFKKTDSQEINNLAIEKQYTGDNLLSVIEEQTKERDIGFEVQRDLPGEYWYSDGPMVASSTGSFIPFVSGVELPNNKILLIPNVSYSIGELYPYLGIYDSINDTFKNGPTHNQDRFSFSDGVLLPNGKVLLIPYNGPVFGLYDSNNNTYINGPSHGLSGTSFYSTGVLVSEDRVLLIPRSSTIPFGWYNISTNTYNTTFTTNLYYMGGILLSNNKVLLYGNAIITLYDLLTNTISPGPSSAGTFISAFKVSDNIVILLSSSSNYMSIYDVTSNTVTQSARIPYASGGEIILGGAFDPIKNKILLLPVKPWDKLFVYDILIDSFSEGFDFTWMSRGMGFIDGLIINSKAILIPYHSPNIGLVDLVEGNEFIFSLYTGTDRSADQTTNSVISFSPEYDNFISGNYLESITSFKTDVLIAGEGEGNERKTSDIGEDIVGLKRRELFVDARDISSKGEKGSIKPEEYDNLLKNRGIEKLSENTIITVFDGNVPAYVVPEELPRIFDPYYIDGPTHGKGSYAFNGGILMPTGVVSSL